MTAKPHMITCWDCDGTGVMGFLTVGRIREAVTCSRCKGRSMCPEEMKGWMEKGLQIRSFRRRADLSMRDVANLCGVSLPVFSDAELGRIDPSFLSPLLPISLRPSP